MRITPLQNSKIESALSSGPTDLCVFPAFRHVRSKFDIHTFETLPSTNTKLWNMLAKGASAGTVVIAQTQTCGRGQRGRTWQSSPGGLYLSLALEPDWPITHTAQITCLSAWGIATAFNNLGIPIKVKWPNDLFYQDKKMGGILTETKLSHFPMQSKSDHLPTGATPRIRQAVIGVGINWYNLVPETAITLTKVLESFPGSAAKNTINCLEVLAAVVLKGILQGYLFQQRVGSQDFMKAYSNLLTQVGKVVSLDGDLLDSAVVSKNVSKARLDELRQLEKCSGEVVGISEEGYLKVALHNISASSANDLKKVSSDSLLGRSAENSLGCIANILLLKPADACSKGSVLEGSVPEGAASG